MRILITGAGGFIGKNLIAALTQGGGHTIYAYDLDTPRERLDGWCRSCEFVFHLAGVNRPKDQAAFMTGNFGFTQTLLETLEKYANPCPVMLASSTQAAQQNPYGQSKRAGEELLFRHGERTGAKAYVFRFPNVYGKWSKPNYNSAVATFCYNIARGLPITVTDPSIGMTLLYIDDLVAALMDLLKGEALMEGPYCTVKETQQATLGEITDLLYGFKASRETLAVADMADPLAKRLYATYLSFLPEEDLSYPLTIHADARGSFTEFLRTPDRGQVSVNVIKPGVVKGNHWHHTKNEKFLVVSGRGAIRFRSALGGPVTEYFVEGERLTPVDIPPGYTHNIENLGDRDMVTLMWASEPFDPDKPDTIYLEV